jgi:hypothetical protein
MVLCTILKKGGSLMLSKLKLIVLIIFINLLIGCVAYIGYRAGQYQADLDYYYDDQYEQWFEEMSEMYRRI